MTIRNTYAAEAWDKVYHAFQQINFTAFDYDTVKESLLQYLKIYHAEHFNDFIESSELVALLELFAYLAETLSYRVDTMAHENFITTAQRKQSILRLARLISYKASRNIPARGLVKINTIRTTEPVFDSLGSSLSNVTIIWNDPNNSNWKEQFFLVAEKALTSKIGQPSKSFQIGDVLMQTYTLNNQVQRRTNGVYSFNVSGGGEQIQMEVVPADIDQNGPFERAPDANSQFNIIYATDGKGDGSDYTGFLMFVKQGSMLRTDYVIDEPTSNRRIEIDSLNVNETDVWVYRVDDDDVITEVWNQVQTVNEQNLFFNNQNRASRKKFEVETLENDKIALLFGDGNFSDIPAGTFQFWTRVSLNETLFIPKNRIAGQALSFVYSNQQNNSHTCSLTFSLTAAIQNNAPSETIEQVRQSAPSTYYAQNRMVNGQDYNTYPLKDTTILRLKTINRTFAGQPKYIEWNDASRKYENVKLFGDDLIMFTDISSDMLETRLPARSVIDSFIEPLLQSPGMFNALVHASATSPDFEGIISYPRRRFIEDNRLIYKQINGDFVTPYGRDWYSVNSGDGSLNEKTVIQGALDQHWYGDATSFAVINGVRHGIIADPILTPEDDGKVYQADLPRTVDGVNPYPPGDVGSGLQQVAPQKIFGMRFNPLVQCFGGGDISLHTFENTLPPTDPSQSIFGKGDVVAPLANGFTVNQHKTEVLTIEMVSDGITFTVISNLRGKLPNYVIGNGLRWSDQHGRELPCDFSISNVGNAFEAGDGFIIDVKKDPDNRFRARVRKVQNLAFAVNFTGWWELIPVDVMTANAEPNDAIFNNIGAANLTENGPDLEQQLTFNQDVNADSWLFFLARIDVNGLPDSWRIFSRNVKTVIQSATTKFWYNLDDTILDSETKKKVTDKIRILRSNLDELGRPLPNAAIYDVIGPVYNELGEIDFSKLEVAPTDTINFIRSGDKTPDNILQFESFSKGSYQYGMVNPDGVTVTWFGCESDGGAGSGAGNYEIVAYDTHQYEQFTYDAYGILYNGVLYYFNHGSDVATATSASGDTIVRRRMVPAPSNPIEENNDAISGCNLTKGLDFMWQHFSPVTNLIDPSVTNIHDMYIMNRGYYASMLDFVKGFSSLEPIPPSPLELRTAYGYLLENKMLSDTVVMHPGKIKLLFGEKSDQRLRARFKVVKAQTATFSDERIRHEVVAVIDKYFDIANWDFGDTFYATELISLIHQRLASQISSVVIVPLYSVNSFGSLFTIESGIDEILQSAANMNDIEIVDALTPTVLRQIR